MRTSDISNTIEDVQRTARVVAPRPAAFAAPPTGVTPAQGAFPNSGPQRVHTGPASGPQQLPPRPPTGPPSGPNPAYGPPPQSAPASGGSGNKPWYIATAVVAVVVIAVVSILVATSGGGGGTAGGCDNREPDDQGFSECMRQLAGAVPEHNDCTKGASNPLGGASIEANNATVASCRMQDSYTVIYMHFGSSDNADGSKASGMDNAQQYMDTVNQQLEAMGSLGIEPETGEWDGDGLSGNYTLFEAEGVGLLVFQVNDSPLTGVLMRTELTGGGSGGSLKDFYDDHVKPGSDGGA